MRHAKVSVNEMARVLQRHRSTIFRELRRNHFQDPCMPKVVGYFAMTAQLRTSDRRAPKFHLDVSTLFRPEAVAHRSQFGHWKADLMLFRQRLGSANVTSLVERVSRFTVLLKNGNERTRPVMDKVIAIRALPHPARRSITFDRGTEFVSELHLQAEIGTKTWFCDPSAPCPPLAAPGARHRPTLRPRHPRDLRPAERHAPQMPRVEDPRRGVPGQDAGEEDVSALP